MQSQPSANERRSLWMLHPRVIATALRRGWRWLTIIYSDDPIRLALNRGFAHIIITFNLMSVIFIFAALAYGEIAAAMVTVVSVPVQVLIWWLNRRGATYGAALYVLWLIAAFVLVSPPASYAGADTPIPLLLIFPVITATLFIRPRAGIWTLILTMTVLGAQLYSSDVPRRYIERFLIIGTLDLAAITIFLMIGASIFWRTLRASIAANEALRRQQEQFYYAALATQDAIYDWDLRTNVALGNETYRRLYVSNDPIAADQTWRENHVHPDDSDRVKSSRQSAFQSHSDFWSDEYRLHRVDSQYATVVDRAYIFYNPARQPVRMIGAMTDITERKQAEAEHLELALARERTELLKEFVNTISHDLKTPLTIINTSLYLLERATDPVNQRVKVEQIKEQVQYLGKLIQDILTLSRLDTLPDFTAHALDINRLLLQVQAQLKALAEERQLTLKMNLDPNVTPVWGSVEDLQRAFTNLVENALHYTTANGTVTIRTFEQANRITVEVSDTGIGIDEDDLPHIFEHFYRADKARPIDAGGTGLGLAIVKKIVNQHRGSIEVESRVGQGSTFRVTLPAAPKTT